MFFFFKKRYYQDFKIDHSTGESNLTQMYIDEGIKFITKNVQNNKPFFLYWTPDATHEPLYASKAFLGKSQRGLYVRLILVDELLCSQYAFHLKNADMGMLCRS